MKTLAVILSFVVGFTLQIVGQNYMGMSQSEIIKSIGEPDRIGTNYFSYNALDEYGENIYYFDSCGNCNSFQIIRNLSYLNEYKRMLNREFNKDSKNKYIRKTRKFHYFAELTLLDDSFHIKIQNLGNISGDCQPLIAGH